MKYLFATLLLALSVRANAQKVFSVDYANQAEVKVFVVRYENQADLKVFRVKYENQAGQNDGNGISPVMRTRPKNGYSLWTMKTRPT